MDTNERKEQSCLMNVEVQQTHLLSSAQLEAAGLFEPQPNRLTWLNTESGGLPGFGKVTADKLQEWGFLDRLLVIREKLLHKDYQPMLADICRRANSKYEEQSGTTYQASVTIQSHFGPSSCQLGPISRAEDETGVKEILRELMQICSEVLLRFVPEINERGRDVRKLAKGSLIPFSKKNLFTSAQLNWTFPEKSLSSSLKKFGSLHPRQEQLAIRYDRHDQFFTFARKLLSRRALLDTLQHCHATQAIIDLFFLCSKLSLFRWQWLLLSPRTFSSSPPNNPWSYSSSQPSNNYPLTRLTIPIYTHTRLIEPRFQYLNPELYVWEDGGNKLYSSQLEHHNFLVNYYIVHEPEIRTRIAVRHWKTLINGIAAQSKGAEEKTWASKIPSQVPGSGPAMLCYAFRTCEHYKIDPKAFDLRTNIPRNGIVDHYLGLFSWIDTETRQRMYPDRQNVIDILKALDSRNEEFEQLKEEQDKLYCGTTFINKKGANSKKGAAKWVPVAEPNWDAKKDRIPSNPNWKGPVNGVPLEQLCTAETLAIEGTNLASAAAKVANDVQDAFDSIH